MDKVYSMDQAVVLRLLANPTDLSFQLQQWKQEKHESKESIAFVNTLLFDSGVSSRRELALDRLLLHALQSHFRGGSQGQSNTAPSSDGEAFTDESGVLANELSTDNVIVEGSNKQPVTFMDHIQLLIEKAVVTAPNGNLIGYVTAARKKQWLDQVDTVLTLTVPCNTCAKELANIMSLDMRSVTLMKYAVMAMVTMQWSFTNILNRVPKVLMAPIIIMLRLDWMTQKSDYASYLHAQGIVSAQLQIIEQIEVSLFIPNSITLLAKTASLRCPELATFLARLQSQNTSVSVNVDDEDVPKILSSLSQWSFRQGDFLAAHHLAKTAQSMGQGDNELNTIFQKTFPFACSDWKQWPFSVQTDLVLNRLEIVPKTLPQLTFVEKYQILKAATRIEIGSIHELWLKEKDVALVCSLLFANKEELEVMQNTARYLRSDEAAVDQFLYCVEQEQIDASWVRRIVALTRQEQVWERVVLNGYLSQDAQALVLYQSWIAACQCRENNDETMQMDVEELTGLQSLKRWLQTGDEMYFQPFLYELEMFVIESKDKELIQSIANYIVTACSNAQNIASRLSKWDGSSPWLWDICTSLAFHILFKMDLSFDSQNWLLLADLSFKQCQWRPCLRSYLIYMGLESDWFTENVKLTSEHWQQLILSCEKLGTSLKKHFSLVDITFSILLTQYADYTPHDWRRQLVDRAAGSYLFQLNFALPYLCDSATILYLSDALAKRKSQSLVTLLNQFIQTRWHLQQHQESSLKQQLFLDILQKFYPTQLMNDSDFSLIQSIRVSHFFDSMR